MFTLSIWATLSSLSGTNTAEVWNIYSLNTEYSAFTVFTLTVITVIGTDTGVALDVNLFNTGYFIFIVKYEY